MKDFPIDDELRARMLYAVTDGTVVSAVDVIAPIVLRHGQPAVLAVARVLADQMIADTGLRPGDTIGVIGTDGQSLSRSTAPHDAARNQVLAYQFVKARLDGDLDRQVALAAHLDGSALCGGLAQAVRTHHEARAQAPQ